MITVNYSPRALQDLKNIQDYITYDSGDLYLAQNILHDIVAHNDQLSVFPELGQRLSERILVNTNYRYIVIHNYVSLYTYFNDSVSIDRVISARQDFVSIVIDNKS